MNALDIITKKRDGYILNADEIEFFLREYVQHRIPNYQMAALLMAVYLRGMDFEETAALTRSMLLSGEKIDLSDIAGPKIDKHSTGGVGDKVSIVLAPLVASAGVNVPMISGRGLSVSGGSLDKLEAIPGFRTRLTAEEFHDTVRDVGVAMIGQTDDIAPADKNIYALRDATSTIESIPLITASILSKKLAENIDGLVLDVKTGGGAFTPQLDQAKRLADSLLRTAELNGLTCRVVVSDMSQPLGYTAGNWLETREAIECLRGKGPDDLKHLVVTLGCHMLVLAGSVRSMKHARTVLEACLQEGRAFDKFVEMVAAQGGDIRYVVEPGNYPPAINGCDVFALNTGYVHGLDARIIGTCVVKLGGGRQVIEDAIDYRAGVELYAKIGDFVEKDQPIAHISSDIERSLEPIARNILSAFLIREERVERPDLIVQVMKSDQD